MSKSLDSRQRSRLDKKDNVSLSSMTRYAFHLLSSEQQLNYVFIHGTFLTSRQEPGKETETILYHVADKGRGFFVELGVDAEQTYFFVLQSFIASEPLEAYTQGVRLPKT